MIKRWVIPDIHGCVKTVRKLIENQFCPIPQDVFYFLMDNHEEFMLKSVEQEPPSGKFFNLGKKNLYKESWLANGGIECLKSFGLTNMNEIPKEYIDWANEAPRRKRTGYHDGFYFISPQGTGNITSPN